MADINIESGYDTERTFVMLDANDQVVDITGTTVTARYRSTVTGAVHTGSATITDAAAGEVTYTFPASHFGEPGQEWHVRFDVDPPPNGTSGRFPDGEPLVLLVWMGV